MILYYSGKTTEKPAIPIALPQSESIEQLFKKGHAACSFGEEI